MNWQDFIGLSGPDFAFHIELGKVREFANAIFAYRPDYLVGERPIMPPTFPVVAGYLWGYMLEQPGDTPLKALGMEKAYSLDAEQEFIYPGPPPRAGSKLTARTWVDKIWEKDGRRGGRLIFYRMRSDYRNEGGHVVGTNYATSVVTDGVPNTPFPEMECEVPFLRMDETRDQLMAINQASWNELVESSGPGAITMPPLTLTDIVRYQIVSGSYGAGHHDAAAARAEGFPTYFSVGMFHAGLLSTYAVNWLGAENVRRFRVRFLDVIWPGEVLAYLGTVKKTYEVQGERWVDIVLDCQRASGEIVTQAWASFVVP